jgi:hypothetical protein
MQFPVSIFSFPAYRKNNTKIDRVEREKKEAKERRNLYMYINCTRHKKGLKKKKSFYQYINISTCNFAA